VAAVPHLVSLYRGVSTARRNPGPPPGRHVGCFQTLLLVDISSRRVAERQRRRRDPACRTTGVSPHVPLARGRGKNVRSARKFTLPGAAGIPVRPQPTGRSQRSTRATRHASPSRSNENVQTGVIP
jgi:hypothetical protein